METKRCSRCKADKPLADYHKNRSNWPDNLVLSCARCNQRKGKKLPQDFLKARRAETD